MSTPSRSTSSDETYDSGLDIYEDDELTFYDGSTGDDVSGSRSELEIRAVDDFAESETDGTSIGSHLEGPSASDLFQGFNNILARLANKLRDLSQPSVESNAVVRPRRGVAQQEPYEDVSSLWYLLPLFMLIPGGIIAWAVNKDRNAPKARKMLLFSIILSVLIMLLVVGVFLLFMARWNASLHGSAY